MDTILRVIVWILAAGLAYITVDDLRRGRAWSMSSLLGSYLALFGAISFGLLTLESFFSPKLSDDLPVMIGQAYPSFFAGLGVMVDDTNVLVGGLVVLAVVVVLALDLLGKINIMAQLQQSINKANTGRPASGDD